MLVIYFKKRIHVLQKHAKQLMDSGALWSILLSIFTVSH